MKKLDYADYIMDIAGAILEFEELRQSLIEIGKTKISSHDKLRIITIAEVCNITNDNMLGILTVLVQIDNSKELQQSMHKILIDKLSSINDAELKAKIEKCGNGTKLMYSLALLDAYAEYLDTGDSTDMPNKSIASTVDTLIKIRESVGIINDFNYYGINKTVLISEKSKQIKGLLRTLTQEQLIKELLLMYQILDTLGFGRDMDKQHDK